MDWGSTVPHKQWSTLPERLWVRVRFMECFRRGNMETAHHCLGDWDFLVRLTGTIFQGKVIWLKLSMRIMIGVLQISLMSISHSCRLTQVQIYGLGQARGVASILWVQLTFQQSRTDHVSYVMVRFTLQTIVMASMWKIALSGGKIDGRKVTEEAVKIAVVRSKIRR